MNIEIFYDNYLRDLAKFESPNGAMGAVPTAWKLNGNISIAGGVTRYSDFTTQTLQESATPGSAPTADEIKSYCFGNLYLRCTVINTVANGGFGSSFWYGANNGLGALFPTLTRGTIVAATPDSNIYPDSFLGVSFNWLQLSCLGAGNSVNFAFKFDGIKVSWGG